MKLWIGTLNLTRRIKRELYYNNSMTIELTDSDKEYANAHGLSYEDMRGFVEDQIREEEMMRTFYETKEKERTEYLKSPQSIYAAW